MIINLNFFLHKPQLLFFFFRFASLKIPLRLKREGEKKKGGKSHNWGKKIKRIEENSVIFFFCFTEETVL